MDQAATNTVTLPASFHEGLGGEIISLQSGLPVVRVLVEKLTPSDAANLTAVLIQALTMAFPSPETRKAYEDAMAASDQSPERSGELN